VSDIDDAGGHLIEARPESPLVEVALLDPATQRGGVVAKRYQKVVVGQATELGGRRPIHPREIRLTGPLQHRPGDPGDMMAIYCRVH
jgi:hypothetical protein